MRWIVTGSFALGGAALPLNHGGRVRVRQEIAVADRRSAGDAADDLLTEAALPLGQLVVVGINLVPFLLNFIGADGNRVPLRVNTVSMLKVDVPATTRFRRSAGFSDPCAGR